MKEFYEIFQHKYMLNFLENQQNILCSCMQWLYLWLSYDYVNGKYEYIFHKMKKKLNPYKLASPFPDFCFNFSFAHSLNVFVLLENLNQGVIVKNIPACLT